MGLNRCVIKVRESHQPALITRKGGDVVLLGFNDWESIQETLHLMDINGSVERITTAPEYQGLNSDDVKSLIDA